MKIFAVMNSEPYVGSFFQAAFSTKEKAEAFITKLSAQAKEDDWGPMALYISEYELDSEKQIEGEK